MEIFMLNRLEKSGEGGAVLCTFFFYFWEIGLVVKLCENENGRKCVFTCVCCSHVKIKKKFDIYMCEKKNEGKKYNLTMWSLLILGTTRSTAKYHCQRCWAIDTDFNFTSAGIFHKWIEQPTNNRR